MLSKEAVKEFKAIWRKQFGEDISDEKAAEEGINLLTILDAIYRPIKKEWADELEQKDNEQKQG
ncbi:MAG: hypothetical protein A2744_00010 [Candidatus Buchananbacteria bacterium RIFCSPHIGHO2_01_FULL_44_11]|uniref:Uncharacterized protein n=1 Tax=Candidatus Buchananbacteria bacterium RIFCSPHIGHO2_01_FULL_44_11 TaxID=1797535 RepID=A0A1G1Y0F2_9BACT|nr:MAG: hypothetical protein A2744_00010 [Candidatus Buchananbacteria bacterium RIFCSPHIGHO2_01_FULL_44_11]